LPIERSVSSSALLFFTALLLFVDAAQAQVIPYIEDIVGEDDVQSSIVRGMSANGELRLIGTFKLFNPDTIPFYMWVSFENGGRFKHDKYTDLPSVRLVDLELRYYNARNQPMVKKFPNSRSEPQMRKRFAGSWLSGGRSSVKKRTPRGRASTAIEDDELDIDIESEATAGRRYRGQGASEITFWKEDAQVYYEMELWGALYSPDVREAVVAGRYVENIKFDIEPAQ